MYERYVHLEFGDIKSNAKNNQKKFVNIKKNLNKYEKKIHIYI